MGRLQSYGQGSKKESQDIQFKKSLGQNFIFDKNLLTAIALDAGVKTGDEVLEIGAGAGTLTDVLSNLAGRVVSFEIDTSLKDRLDLVKSKHQNLEIVYGDFMLANIGELGLTKAKVIANIPYYITTPIVFKLIDDIKYFESITILIQKEVAERFAARCGNKEYGITSVILQSIFDVEVTRIVKKECFTPSPKVDSAVIKMVPHGRYKVEDFEAFKLLVKSSFSMRRKTLINNLKDRYKKEKVSNALSALGLKENIRPEDISVENYIKLYQLLNGWTKIEDGILIFLLILKV